jgi:hypothetical protein
VMLLAGPACFQRRGALTRSAIAGHSTRCGTPQLATQRGHARLRIVSLRAALAVMVLTRSAAQGAAVVGVDTGTLPRLPGFALSSAQPVTNITTTTAPTATSKMMIRAVFVRTGTRQRS